MEKQVLRGVLHPEGMNDNDAHVLNLTGVRPNEVAPFTPGADPKLGRKADNDKPRWSLLPWDALEEVVKVLTHGAKKYAPNNFKFVVGAAGPEGRYFDAAHRHLKAWAKGEKLDKDSNLPHLACAICSLLFLLWFDLNPDQTPPKE